ncbi:50S ribosomal protein L29 [Desulfohalobium retbaense]|uniref:Large ribosomal subunit protein uL29 n=1 Tax=Desulfohalobium retbaense (strain ATCC 49708 / DSM 5692 / JCM 16813 / HR100) TaxID=485915 RepID=C8X467_DESRD|nr:50S ribosomal protein L29 [Desulfohalobium retbaense]ACV69341.1 ribosomal protein L29 [Desulfohalobium retbaense DSM 5692]
MDASKLREMERTELTQKLADFEKELFNLRFQHATAQLDNTQRLPQVKRTIAQIKTVMREKEMESGDE